MRLGKLRSYLQFLPEHLLLLHPHHLLLLPLKFHLLLPHLLFLPEHLLLLHPHHLLLLLPLQLLLVNGGGCGADRQLWRALLLSAWPLGQALWLRSGCCSSPTPWGCVRPNIDTLHIVTAQVQCGGVASCFQACVFEVVREVNLRLHFHLSCCLLSSKLFRLLLLQLLLLAELLLGQALVLLRLVLLDQLLLAGHRLLLLPSHKLVHHPVLGPLP